MLASASQDPLPLKRHILVRVVLTGISSVAVRDGATRCVSQNDYVDVCSVANIEEGVCHEVSRPQSPSRKLFLKYYI